MSNRRAFVARIASGMALGILTSMPEVSADEPFAKSRIKAIAFDAFPIFDPRPIFALAERIFPGKGGEFSNEWRTRQFEYTWLRVTLNRYVDFWQVTRQALEFAAEKLTLKLSQPHRDELMQAYLELKTWPDVMPALAELKHLGFRLAFLSNFTPAMLEANIRSAALAGEFEQLLSTDDAKTYKPDRRAYQLGLDVLKLERAEIMFVAFAGWDAAGAKLFGYPTYWVNRQKLPEEKLDATPDGVGETLGDLVRFLS